MPMSSTSSLAPCASTPRLSSRFGRGAVLLAIRVYQLLISPLLGPHCRFAPSCSAYAADAIARYGVARGGWQALRRVARCHPRHPGGYDPVA
jgi:putative membrane protein insertion efficiency factor